MKKLLIGSMSMLLSSFTAFGMELQVTKKEFSKIPDKKIVTISNENKNNKNMDFLSIKSPKYIRSYVPDAEKITVYRTNDEFFINDTKVMNRVQSYNVSKELRCLTPQQLFLALNNGHISVKRNLINEYLLNLIIDIKGGGPVGFAIGWIGGFVGTMTLFGVINRGANDPNDKNKHSEGAFNVACQVGTATGTALAAIIPF